MDRPIFHNLLQKVYLRSDILEYGKRRYCCRDRGRDLDLNLRCATRLSNKRTGSWHLYWNERIAEPGVTLSVMVQTLSSGHEQLKKETKMFS